MISTLIEKILTYYEHLPLKSILLVGLFFRLLAVIFSKGFGWIDDQFLIIEIAQSWADGVDYYGWLPDEAGVNKPKGFSFFLSLSNSSSLLPSSKNTISEILGSLRILNNATCANLAPL